MLVKDKFWPSRLITLTKNVHIDSFIDLGLRCVVKVHIDIIGKMVIFNSLFTALLFGSYILLLIWD